MESLSNPGTVIRPMRPLLPNPVDNLVRSKVWKTRSGRRKHSIIHEGSLIRLLRVALQSFNVRCSTLQHRLRSVDQFICREKLGRDPRIAWDCVHVELYIDKIRVHRILLAASESLHDHRYSLNWTIMSITLSTKTSPFPYASIAIATYTQKVDINYDESVDAVTLDFEGSQISANDEIVAVLANAGGLAGDSVKVLRIFDITHTSLTESITDCRVFWARKNCADIDSDPRYPCSSRFFG